MRQPDLFFFQKFDCLILNCINPFETMKSGILFFLSCFLAITVSAQQKQVTAQQADRTLIPVIQPGAEQLKNYLDLLLGKRVAVFANQTSVIGPSHLVDSLQKLGVDIRVIFGPEHGFRGDADAGEKVGNYIDKRTGIPVISLYGAKRRPDEKDLQDIDVMIFDIQDVGVRFYTFISSLEAYIQSAVEFNKPLIVLDRPNPNGFYVDGPVLDTTYRSFIGRQPIPIVYGLTIGEYAGMLLGEGWIQGNTPVQNDRNVQGGFGLTVIKCANYTHRSLYVPPIKPSPNLPDIQTIYLYPSTCFFEGTDLSEGRGTNKPFMLFGHPSLPASMTAFTPQPNAGAKSSKHYGKQCYGWELSGTPQEILAMTKGQIQLKWLLEAYRLFPEKDSFFLLPKSGDIKASFFNKLAGNNDLWQQVRDGLSEEEIKKSWEPALSQYKLMRKKYLLYEDFE